MAIDKVMVDTNVLLHFAYTDFGNDPIEISGRKHDDCREQLFRFRRERTQIWINGQIIREFWRASSLRQTNGKMLPTEEIVQTLQRFRDVMRVADETEAVREQLLTLVQEYSVRGLAVHDANIVATMLAHNIDSVCTLDNDFARYGERVTIIQPQASSA